MKRTLVAQGLGELILYVPLIFLAQWMGILEHVASSMFVFFACKWTYRTTTPLHLENGKHCALASYGIFLCIGVITEGLRAILGWGTQIMLPVILTIGATYIWATLGVVQSQLHIVKSKTPDPHGCNPKG